MNTNDYDFWLHLRQVGELYCPGIRSWAEESKYEYHDGTHDLVLFRNGPTEREAEAARTGEAEFALLVQDGVIMLCHRFGEALPWANSAFTQWLVPPAARTLPTVPESAAGAFMFVSLVDASTGLLLTFKAVALSPEFRAALHKAIRRQARTAFIGREHYEKRVARIRRRYPTTEDMVAAATARGTGGSRGPAQASAGPNRTEDGGTASHSVQVDVQEHGSVNDVFLGINYYISTGDHYGEGGAIDMGAGVLALVVPYDPSKPQEIADLTALKVRLEELRQAGIGLREETPPIASSGRVGQFDFLLLHVHQDDLVRLAQGLVREPGKAGWGSTYPLLQAAFPEVRGMILSGEGT